MNPIPDVLTEPLLRFSSGQSVRMPDGQHDHGPLEIGMRDLAKRLSTPSRGSKGSAGYYMAVECAAGKRTAESVIGGPQFVMVDLDQGQWDAESIRLELDGFAFFAHTTASHLTVTDSNPMGEPRWRVIVPIVGATLKPKEHYALALSIHRMLGWNESVDAASFDKCGTKLVQPIYWPTYANEEEARRFEWIDALDVGPMSVEEMARRVEEEIDREAERAARAKAERLERPRQAGGSGIIDAFNESHDLAEMLETLGYEAPRPPRTQWISPRSKSRTPALVLLKGDNGSERIYSHRGSDAGTEWECMDAFDLYRMHHHGGDTTKAVREAARKMKMPTLVPVKPDDQDESDSFTPYPIYRFDSIEPNLTNNDIVKGVIARESIVVMYGQSGSTKSFCATEIGLAIASGQPWRGHRSKRGKVVYIAAEGARGMRNRIAAAKMHLALGPAESVEFFLVPSVVRLIEETPDVDRFVQTIQQISGHGAALVIIDTLSQSMPGADENGPKDMTAAIAAAQRIRDGLGTAVLIVHHSGKDVAKGARGHSSLRAATDTELEVTQDADGLCRVRATKQKEGETGAEWLHRLESVELGVDEDGEPVTTAIVKPIGAGEAAAITAARRSKSGKASKLTIDVIEACHDLHATGRAQPIPRNALDASGYLVYLRDQDWDTEATVRGFDRNGLIEFLIQRYEGDDERRESDENATMDRKEIKRLRDKKRSNAKRRIEKGIEEKVLCAHGEWVWLKEPQRDGSDG